MYGLWGATPGQELGVLGIASHRSEYKSEEYVLGDEGAVLGCLGCVMG